MKKIVKRLRKWLIAAVVCLLAVLIVSGKWVTVFRFFGWMPENEDIGEVLIVDVINVGNADAILLRSGEEAMLIDAGENADDGYAVVNYLRLHGVGQLDCVCATHFDADHIGGMEKVILGMPIGRFLLASVPDELVPTDPSYQRMQRALTRKRVTVCDLAAENAALAVGDSFTLGHAVCTVLWPLEIGGERNETSVVLLVDMGEKRFLFMGDAGTATEENLLEMGIDMDVDVLKVGHHGSRTSSSEAFLKSVTPEIALVTCGADNRYGHPHGETLDRLAAVGATVYRSDKNGHITVTCDGNAVTVDCQRHIQ